MTSSKNGHIKPILRAGEIGILHSQILALYPLLCPSVHSEIAQASVNDASATGRRQVTKGRNLVPKLDLKRYDK